MVTVYESTEPDVSHTFPYEQKMDEEERDYRQ
jgi:hypothetical protein